MKVTAYSIKSCEKELLIKANGKKHDITLISNRLTDDTVSYAEGKDAVLVFACDDVSAPVIRKLHDLGVKYIATRSAGTDHIDLEEATRLGMKIANIPAYSPESVAEHAITLMMALTRNIVPAHQQMLEFDFTLDDLVGNTIHEKTIGIVGLGKTGLAFGRILQGFGAKILVHDVSDVAGQCTLIGASQVSYDELLTQSDIISFHVPLTNETRHMVNNAAIQKMKKGVILINVSRGAIFNSLEVFHALQREKIGKIGMDVYEFEHNVFFFDHSHKPIGDQLLRSFIQNSRVLLTPHIAFLTKEALEIISEQLIGHLDSWAAGKCVDDACSSSNTCTIPQLQKTA